MTLRKAGIEYRGWEVEEAPAVATDGNFTVLFSSKVPFAKQRTNGSHFAPRPPHYSTKQLLDAPETRNAHSAIADDV